MFELQSREASNPTRNSFVLEEFQTELFSLKICFERLISKHRAKNA